MITVNDVTIMSYGKSMFGGWYADLFKEGNYDGIHTNTLRDLCAKLKVSQTALIRDVTRIDN